MARRGGWVAALCMALAAAGALDAAPRNRARVVGLRSSTRIVRVPAYVNNVRLSVDALKLKGPDRAVLPMRALFTALDARVMWDAADREVTAWKNDGTGVRFGVGKRQAELLLLPSNPRSGDEGTVNGLIALDAPAVLINGLIYVPIRAAGEALGADTHWIGTAPAVHIRTDFYGTRPELSNPQLREEARALTFSMVIPSAFVRYGETVPVRLVLRNIGSRQIKLPLRSHQPFEVRVLKGETVIWNWARATTSAPEPLSLTLEPGREVTFQTNWRLVNNKGRRVPPGVYTIQAFVTAAPLRQWLNSEQEIEVDR
jgi:copper amine oxidase-like protein/intracellular proteinase inhibitor BsuPI